jgi:hypothetical protein
MRQPLADRIDVPGGDDQGGAPGVRGCVGIFARGRG